MRVAPATRVSGFRTWVWESSRDCGRSDVGGLAGADDAHQVGLEGMGGQRQQAGLFFGPDVGDTAVGLVGVTPPVGDLVSPAAELGVDVVEVAEGAGGEPKRLSTTSSAGARAKTCDRTSR